MIYEGFEVTSKIMNSSHLGISHKYFKNYLESFDSLLVCLIKVSKEESKSEVIPFLTPQIIENKGLFNLKVMEFVVTAALSSLNRALSSVNTKFSCFFLEMNALFNTKLKDVEYSKLNFDRGTYLTFMFIYQLLIFPIIHNPNLYKKGYYEIGVIDSLSSILIDLLLIGSKKTFIRHSTATFFDSSSSKDFQDSPRRTDSEQTDSIKSPKRDSPKKDSPNKDSPENLLSNSEKILKTQNSENEKSFLTDNRSSFSSVDVEIQPEEHPLYWVYEPNRFPEDHFVGKGLNEFQFDINWIVSKESMLHKILSVLFVKINLFLL